MRRSFTIAFLASVLCCTISYAAGKNDKKIVISPDATYLYAEKDSTELYLDIYEPTIKKYKKAPTIVFAFGGGFKGGTRDGEHYKKWFRQMQERGFRLVSIDYRLGLKNVKGLGINLKSIGAFEHAIQMAVEDLFSATSFLVENAAELGIDPTRLIASGSSAGAITALQGEWLICNSSKTALELLPNDFNYAGVMEFAGAIFSTEGKAKFENEPCPVLFCHGNEDRIVHFGHIQIFNYYLGSSPAIAGIFADKGFNYNYLCFNGNGHEIARSMEYFPDEIVRFIEWNVLKGEKRIVEANITDPTIEIPSWGKQGLSSLY